MKTVVVVLQNAWSPVYAGGVWPRESWLRALRASRSGQRLAVLERVAGKSIRWHFDNTTPEVGDHPDSVKAADPNHIANLVALLRPEIVVACGKQAAKALRFNTGGVPLLIVPHPASRLLTNRLYERAGMFVRNGFIGDLEIRQLRGRTQIVRLTR